jgi:Lamin Tail Domain/CotH kinase protein
MNMRLLTALCVFIPRIGKIHLLLPRTRNCRRGLFAWVVIGMFAVANAATTIAIRNPSFESGVALGEGGFTSGDIPQWEDRIAATVASGVFNPDTPLSFAADGTHVVFFNPGGYINQDLRYPDTSNVVAQAGMTVNVSLQARGRAGDACSLRFDLRTTAGISVTGGSVTVAVPVNTTGYTPISAALTLPGSATLGANAGQALYLFIDNPSAVQVNIDSVTATATLPPVIASLSASPNPITAAGGSATLSWTVTGATSLTLNGAPVAGSSTVVTPAATTTYTLVATNADGAVSASTIIAVSVPNDLRISEFMAANVSALADGDGQFSDWVEIENLTGGAISTSGYFLTDDRANLAKWPFPARTIAAGGRLLVFCSGKSVSHYADAAGHPHANFRLADEGEYLALVGPGGIVSEFFPAYAAQFPNISYGRGLAANRFAEPLVGSGAALKYIVPSAEIPGWQSVGFADGGWAGGVMSIGFDQNYGPLTTALSTPANTAGNQAFGLGLGMDFVVTQSVEVTELGCFDDLSNGIAAGVTLTVQLWRRNENGTPANFGDDTGTAVLATTTFTNASPGTLANGNRFKAITPVTLAPGAYTINAYGFTAAERNGNGLTVTASGGGALSFVGPSRYGASAGAFPATPDGGPATRYCAGSFRFRTVPGTNVTTNIAASMHNANPGAFIRVPFTLASPQFAALTLNISYDDGFAAYLNGTPIASRNVPASPAYNAAAGGPASLTESIDISAHAALLANGANVLAVHGLNVSAADVDFKINATLTGERTTETLAYFTSPTPGAPNGAGVLYPRVVISEIHSDPVDSNTYPTEFIELYNPTSAAVDASGWAFTRGVTFTFPPGTSIPARGYLVVAENPAVLLARLGAVSIGPWVGSLANDGETIELVDALGAVVDSVDYGLGFPWPTVGDDGGSIQLLNEGLDNELGGAWRSAAPTAGASGTGSTVNVPPIVRQVNHTFAASPTPTSAVPANTPVLISAKITDADGVFAAAVEYQPVEPGNYIRLTDAAFATNWTAITMRDDGTNGDAIANDAVFSALIPAGVQLHRRLIRYRIVATDGLAQSLTVPLATQPSPNFAYFCYDGVPAWTAAVQPGVTAASVFSEGTMRKVRPWHLLSQAGDVQNCQYNGAFNDGVYRFEGALVVDGRVYDHVRYRVKGQGSTFNTGKNKWKVKFNRGEWFDMPDEYGERTTTIATLNISSVPSSWAPWNRGLAGLDEVLQYRLSELAGVPSPRTSYFQLRVIDGAVEAAASQYDGDLWGLYIGFENQDNRFKAGHGLPDGNIFRMQSGNTHLLGQGAGQPDNLSDLQAFTSPTTGYNKGTAGNVGTYQTVAWFRANVDLPRYYSWRAVTEAVNNTDIRDQENVVYFRDPLTGRWHIEPWDCDLLYEQLDRWGPKGTQAPAGQPSTPYEQIRRGLAHPALKIEFQNRARELQDLLLNSDQAWKLMDEYISLISDEAPRIIPNGGAVSAGFVEADRRRWDYWPSNPVPPRGNGAFGNYYKTPYPIPNMGNGPFPQPFNRTLASADFAGLVKWAKDFVANDAYGGARLREFALGQRDLYTLNATGATQQIPNTPVLTDLSPGTHPLNNLVFQTSAFSSPNAQAFAAIQWRIAECRWPGLIGHVNGKSWRYEIEETWATGELPVFNNQIAIPPQPLEAGVTYRVRVKMKDAAGHWSHWSAPIEFATSAPDVSAYVQNLVVSEVMYKPVGGSDYEFIELRNLSASIALDLSPVTISSGVDYAFPSGTSLAPGALLIVPKNLAAFQSRYGAALPTVAEWGASDSLNNGGDTITLNYGANVLIRTFTYGTAAPWPDIGDTGRSIVLKIPGATAPDHAIGTNWRASVAQNGNPGASDALSFTGNANDDLDSDDLVALLEYALATSDTNNAEGRAAWSLTSIGGAFDFTYQRPVAADDITYAIESSTDLAQPWQPAGGTVISDTQAGPLRTIVTRLTPPVGEPAFLVRLKASR